MFDSQCLPGEACCASSNATPGLEGLEDELVGKFVLSGLSGGLGTDV